MTSPPQPSIDPTLAKIVRNHEKRIGRLERILYYLAGAASGCTGTWLTVIMSRR